MKNNNLIMGFDTINDFFISAFGIKSLKFNLCMALLTGISTFFTNWIYDAPALYFMFCLLGLDTLTGVYRAIKKRNFSSAKLPRCLVLLITYVVMLCISTQAAKYSVYFTSVSGIVYGGIIATLLVSVFENLYQVGLIKKNLYDLVIDRIKIKKEE
jgi:hypothetical protein